MTPNRVVIPDRGVAVHQLYEAFRSYPKPSRMLTDGNDVTLQHPMLSKPLVRLQWEDLGRYAGKALTTQGSLEDFKYFLPRLLELATEKPEECVIDEEIVFGKLNYGHFAHWPDCEQAAVIAFAWSWWRDELHRPVPAGGSQWDEPREIGRVLCSLGQFVADLRPFLDFWREQEQAAPVWRMAYFIVDSLGLAPKGKLGNSFWHSRETQAGQVMAWISEPFTRASIEEAWCRYQDEPIAADLSRAEQMLGSIHFRQA